MNKLVNKILLARDKFMPEIDLRQPRFTYIVDQLLKTKKRIQKGDSRSIYQNKLNKICFQHDTAYGDFINLPRRTASHKVLRDKFFNIAKNKI